MVVNIELESFMFLSRILASWIKRERALVITEDYEITGWLYNPGLSKTNRFLTDLLNGANKNFIAIKDCDITYKNKQGQVEHLDFLQLNMKYIILIKPLKIDEEEEEGVL